MNRNESTILSCMLAAMAGICFVQGLVILTTEKGLNDHGTITQIRNNA